MKKVSYESKLTFFNEQKLGQAPAYNGFINPTSSITQAMPSLDPLHYQYNLQV